MKTFSAFSVLVDPTRVRRTRVLWHKHCDYIDRRCALATSIGWPLSSGKTPDWLRVVSDLSYTRTGLGALRLLRAAAVKFMTDEEGQRAFDAVCRFASDKRRQVAWLKAYATGEATARPTDEERAAVKAGARAKLLKARADHAVAKLGAAQKKLATAERLVAKWGAKVNYYRKNGILSEET